MNCVMPNTPAFDNLEGTPNPFDRGQQAATASVPTTSLDQGVSQISPPPVKDAGAG
jgi:hypothetical protein